MSSRAESWVSYCVCAEEDRMEEEESHRIRGSLSECARLKVEKDPPWMPTLIYRARGAVYPRNEEEKTQGKTTESTETMRTLSGTREIGNGMRNRILLRAQARLQFRGLVLVRDGMPLRGS